MSLRSWLLCILTTIGILAGISFIPRWTQYAQTAATGTAMPPVSSFRILFGVGDTEPAVWDGSIKLSSGAVRSIQGWRFAVDDSSDYKSSWKVSTRSGAPQNGAQRRNGVTPPVNDNGVIVSAQIPDNKVTFDVQTAKGGFSFSPQEIPLGESKTFLDGKVAVDRVPSTVQLTTSDEDQDNPAIAVNGDDVWITYVDFTHGDRSKELLGIMPKEPESFDFLARPVGGDQVMLQRFSKSANVWDRAVPVSARGQDVARAAVAIDGQQRVWTIWSANRDGNSDIYAKAYSSGKWSPEIRLTSDPGTDVNPVAATDSKGRVWVAWQAFRGNNLEVLAAVQNGGAFSPEARVSFSPASDWDPAIAAAPNGDVAISWDTYDKGDYDVYFRRLRADGEITMDPPIAVAASQNFEARSSVAFDARNRLWVAYEVSGPKWGKDYGAYETTGISLYQGHNVQVKCFDGANAFTTSEDIQDALPGPVTPQRRQGRRPVAAAQSPGNRMLPPDVEAAAQRPPNGDSRFPVAARNSFPRLTVDSEGKVFVAVRSMTGARTPVGTHWGENLVYFDGVKWIGPIVVPRTDGLLDNRPALAAIGPGRLLIVSAMDHRQSQPAGGGPRAARGLNSDIYAADLRIDSVKNTAQPLKPLPAEPIAAAEGGVKPEADQVAMMRNYRVNLASGPVRLMRGEFHRHTEMSGDGGNDGPLIDAYRYMIDAGYMDWVACCDHDNGAGHEYFWWQQQKLTDAYHLGEKFVPMFGYERSVRYPEGHRNVVTARRGVRPLPRLAKMEDDSPPSPAPDTQMLYKYLRQFGGIVASHTSGTDMGTDWRDNDPVVEPVVEIYQGDRQNYEMPDAPRSNSAADSIGGWRPLGFVSLALKKGYKLGFQASSDHKSTHMSYCNLWVTAPTREAIMDAFHKRRIYGSTDNILADVRSGSHFMGEEFAVSEPPAISVKLAGTAPLAKVHIIKDGNYVYSISPNRKNVNFSWTDNAAERGKTAYYYVRGEQADGELVWVSPMWITYR